jgi:hypothetical protein
LPETAKIPYYPHMKLAIMQPYLFPYIGYFQLVNAVEKFVFYDDVQFIKGGWINRNYILEKGERKLLFTLHLHGASSNKRINEIRVKDNSKKVIKTIRQNYSTAPFFDLTFPIIEKVISSASKRPLISEIASSSVCEVSNYLGIKTIFTNSSDSYPETLRLGRLKRLTTICSIENAVIYANPHGGKDLYTKGEFKESGIELNFIKTNNIQYNQFNNKFIPNLSIIDILMFNSPLQVIDLLNNFELK